MTGNSSLDPDNFPAAPDRVLGKGHGTGALGPSDSSDSGSDVQGGLGQGPREHGGVQQGTNEDSGSAPTAGPDLGDSNLDSDTDRNGTGERAAAGRDTVLPDGADIDVDHIETVPLPQGEGTAPD
ncbi:hypothetical protein [Massilia sp. erpn]|uniref:hypothetical protein n=1 Tax=Massilia sp. erpn TaxID=2738142 RepID=UPI002106EAC8|nr:hypothetical protein [Massilia sp. erpn]UTY55820.1 hypothetical protein HPQ68_00660 [Massilia sp. erpn]